MSENDHERGHVSISERVRDLETVVNGPRSEPQKGLIVRIDRLEQRWKNIDIMLRAALAALTMLAVKSAIELFYLVKTKG